MANAMVSSSIAMVAFSMANFFTPHKKKSKEYTVVELGPDILVPVAQSGSRRTPTRPSSMCVLGHHRPVRYVALPGYLIRPGFHHTLCNVDVNISIHSSWAITMTGNYFVLTFGTSEVSDQSHQLYFLLTVWSEKPGKTEKEASSNIESDIVDIQYLQNSIEEISSVANTSEEIMNSIKGGDDDIPSAMSPNADDLEAITVDETNIVSCNPLMTKIRNQIENILP
ncbi:unnamed protein product [Lepeophtheirus salmonis]|uniref:(salmon louse) hypothetical protein n=1 Tax=Lepeophtheirus salmonis TaxID=72036 RepID=A0A7R8HB57_LEPSM|nr:unnamed protein product [Lepeophtheirus salmonis]CAF2986999.1 unnamed protein product [Lepeophtheirus salmonis]